MNDAIVIDAGMSPAPIGRLRKLTRKQLIIVVAATLALLGILWYAEHWFTVGRFMQSTDDAYVGGDVTLIAPKVAGFIETLAVSDNQDVHAGDLLIKLDDRDYRAALARADAAVAGAEATLANLDATRRLQQTLIAQARAVITAAEAEVVRTHDDQVRFQQLSSRSA